MIFPILDAARRIFKLEVTKRAVAKSLDYVRNRTGNPFAVGNFAFSVDSIMLAFGLDKV